jgi:16S rRNA (uracil1498-N3)-methyltransferase
MSERFFVDEPITAERVTLDGAEAHHLLHVMRAGLGEAVTLFDDSGAEFTAIIDQLGRSDVQLRVDERREVNRELPFSLVVGVALPKGERQKWLVGKLTELGIASLVPLETERGVAQPTGNAIQRLRRTVIEAAKQCGRNRLMQIAEPQAWADWTIHTPTARSLESAQRRFLAHPGGMPLSKMELSTPRTTRFAVGPEGGFTDTEVALATDAGWQAADLGPRILRVETAAVAMAATIVQSCSHD